MSAGSVEIVSWGLAGSVRDAGRLGRAGLGAGRGGAVDMGALALANRLVGNAADAAGIESSGGLRLRVVGSAAMLAVAGGVAAIDVVHGPPLGWGAPAVLPADAQITIGRLIEGTRVYVAIRGGVEATRGAHLLIGPDPGTPVAADAAPRPMVPDRFRVWPGPRLDWFESDAWHVLTNSVFRVSADSDRVGMRLSGPSLVRLVERELPSEGMVEGAIQVPPDGAPIVMLADHPVTGGYPVIAVVDPRDLGHLAQMAAGSSVRFTAHR